MRRRLLAEADGGVVDDGVEGTGGAEGRRRVGGFGVRLARSATKAASAPGAAARASRRRESLRGVEGDGVALVDEVAGGHEAEAVGGTGDEDACHSKFK